MTSEHVPESLKAFFAEHPKLALAFSGGTDSSYLLYAALASISPSPVVELNRAVAVAMADGPDAGLALLEPLAAQLDGYHLFHAARADLLRRAGRPGDAVGAYRRALERATNPAERRFLERRAGGA
jgi:RNA polymerase sigma-70 factor (ECF subfamily)